MSEITENNITHFASICIQNHFEKVKEIGTMILPIPVHPIAWRKRTPEKYLELLDQAVECCIFQKSHAWQIRSSQKFLKLPK